MPMNRKWLLLPVTVLIIVFVFLVPIIPATADTCHSNPLQVQFSLVSIVTNHDLGAFYLQNTNAYHFAPFTPAPYLGSCLR